MQIKDTVKMKMVRSSGYNYTFHKENGLFVRWGTNLDDDPAFSPYGPEILDLEISSGKCKSGCKFCYKRNGPNEEEVNMTFEQFKIILDKMPKVLTQIAFGLCDMHSNPDFFKMAMYARSKGIIPNFTTSGQDVTPVVAELAGRLCGALAVSIVNKEKSYDAIKLFTDEIGKPGNTLNAVNIHFMLSEETWEKAFNIIDDVASDPRLKKVNAIVYLQYKPKGHNTDAFHPISTVKKYKKLIAYSKDKGVGAGFDSCSAPLFFKTVEGQADEEQMLILAEPCESGLFSSYINCEGKYFACSFCEGEKGWEEGLDVLNCQDFLKDVWFAKKAIQWRATITTSSCGCNCKFVKQCRSCPVFNVTACKDSQNVEI